MVFCDRYGLYFENLVGPKADLTAFTLKTGVVKGSPEKIQPKIQAIRI